MSEKSLIELGWMMWDLQPAEIPRAIIAHNQAAYEDCRDSMFCTGNTRW